MVESSPQVSEMFARIGGFDAVQELAPDLFILFEETVAQCRPPSERGSFVV